MKKLALLLALGLLAACGGSGGSSTSATATTPASNATSTESGTLTVRINEPKQIGKFYNYTSPDSTRRRVMITNTSLNDPANGLTFKKYYDYRTGRAPALTFSLPYANGYVIEFLEYSVTAASTFATYSTNSATKPPAEPSLPATPYAETVVTPANNILKYAKTTVDLSTGSGSVSLTPKSVPSPTFRFPQTGLKFGAYSGIPAALPGVSSTFKATKSFANISTPSMFNANQWDLSVRQRMGTNQATVKEYTGFPMTLSGDSVDISSPIAYESNYYQMRGLAYFYLNSTMLIGNEPYNKFSKMSSVLFMPVVVKTISSTIPIN